MIVLAARGLEVCAGQFPVLRNIDLDLAAGGALGLVGEAGAGTSLPGLAIGGALPTGFRATAGRLEFFGRDLLGMTASARRALFGRDIAFLPRDAPASFDPLRTVGAQMRDHFRRVGANPAEVGAALDALGANPRAYPHRLSAALCQAIAVAMAFASGPKLLVAEDPTRLLDAGGAARVLVLLEEFRRAHGTALLLATHDVGMARELCDEVAVLYAGSVAERGAARAVFDLPAHPYTRCLLLATPAMDGPPGALYALPDRAPGVRAIAGMPGCRFEPRCPLASLECRQGEPALREVAAGRWSSCLRPADASGFAPLPGAAASSRTPGKTLLALDAVTRLDAALGPVSLAIAHGEFLGIVGASGSGKSALGRLIAGFERPDGGRILLDGVDTSGGAAGKARARTIATVRLAPGDARAALNPRRRVVELVTQAMEPFGRDLRARESRARELARLMDLSSETMGRVPAELSDADCQRVNIARALCGAPKLLVLDGVDAGLDVSERARLLTLLARLRAERHIAVLFMSRDFSAARQICDRVAVLDGGAIREARALSGNSAVRKM